MKTITPMVSIWLWNISRFRLIGIRWVASFDMSIDLWSSVASVVLSHSIRNWMTITESETSRNVLVFHRAFVTRNISSSISIESRGRRTIRAVSATRLAKESAKEGRLHATRMWAMGSCGMARLIPTRRRRLIGRHRSRRSLREVISQLISASAGSSRV